MTGRLTRAAAITAISASALVVAPMGMAQAATPGTVIGVTAQPAGWHHDIPNGSSVEYWTTRSNGEPVKASGAMFVPDGPAPAGGWPIMAYDHGTTGLGPRCGGQADANAPMPGIQAYDDNTMRYFVSKGFAVVAPDHLGLGLYDTGPHPYLELASEASATIDMVRAVRAARPDMSRTWAVTGASQGGHAALGAAYAQIADASDLDFRGTIAIDPASDVEKVLPIAGPWVPEFPGAIGGGVNSFFVSILAGLRATHPEADVDGYLTDSGRQLLDSVGSLCLPQILEKVKGVAIGDMLARPLNEGPLPAALNRYMTVPTRGYNAPILLLVNVTDTTVPSPLHGALAAQFAANGVDFRTVTGTGQHCDLNPQMWAAIDQFTDRMLATPTLP